MDHFYYWRSKSFVEDVPIKIILIAAVSLYQRVSVYNELCFRTIIVDRVPLFIIYMPFTFRIQNIKKV